MDGVSHFQHFLLANVSVVVEIIKSESPQQLIVQSSFADHRQKFHEIAEGDSSSLLPEESESFKDFFPDYLAGENKCTCQ